MVHLFSPAGDRQGAASWLKKSRNTAAWQEEDRSLRCLSVAAFSSPCFYFRSIGAGKDDGNTKIQTQFLTHTIATMLAGLKGQLRLP